MALRPNSFVTVYRNTLYLLINLLPPVSRTLLSRVAALTARLEEGRAPVSTVTQAEAPWVRISVEVSSPLCSPPVTR